MKKIIVFLIVVLLPLAVPGTAGAWRSMLYPAEWTPPDESARFYSDKIIQDFSYAGYARSEEPLPAVSGPVFDVTDYGAQKDDSGDSRAAIQAAIDAAGSAGGGVVYLPAGTYRLSKSGSNCLRISRDGVVLRGDGPTRTFLYCTDPDMRQSVIIRFEPASAENKSGSVALSQDIDGPAIRLYLENADTFSVGDRVLLEWDFTYDWIAEHGQLDYWNPNTSLGVPAAGNMRRIITAVDQSEKWIQISVPTRYSMKTRDSARVSRISGQLRECGVEDLAIGSVMNTMAGWAENDYTNSSKGAYYTHDSYALRFKYSENCWAARVRTFSPGNENGSHIPSNGLNLVSSRFVTVRECLFSKPQYGGGGGNGYMYRLQDASECLVADCVADFSRHGIVVSQSGTNGNVFLRCTDKNTGRQCGLDGSDLTNGNCSDNHMHFSHANLYDNCRAINSGYEALHRTYWGTIAHALTAAHTVYWNTYGENATGGSVVKSQQGRYGYIIGTRGPSSAVSTPTGNGTSPKIIRRESGSVKPCSPNRCSPIRWRCAQATGHPASRHRARRWISLSTAAAKSASKPQTTTATH